VPEPVSLSGQLITAVFEIEIYYSFDRELTVNESEGASANKIPELSNDAAVAHILQTRALDKLSAAAQEHFETALRDDAVQVDVVVRTGGSVEILVAVSTVAAVIRNYNDIVQGVTEAVESTRRAFREIIRSLGVLRAFAGRMELRSSWRPGRALAPLRAASARRTSGSGPTLPSVVPLLLASSVVQVLLLVALIIVVVWRT